MKTDVEKILEAVSVTAELTGADLSENAKAAMVEELLPFGVGKSLDALNRCRRELTGRLTLAAVLQRIDTGLPSADEAWGLVSEGLRDERVTVVVPAIAQQAVAMGAAELLRNGDKTGARMAFKAAYEKLAGGLDLSGGVRWVVERGWDTHYAFLVGQHDLLFVLPQFRKGRTGLRLMAAFEAAAKEKGAGCVLYHAKPDSVFARLLQRQRARIEECVFFKEV